jgi:predicted nucleic acid-binding protein
MIIVSDTTPLNYLILIDQVHILHELYESVLIPQSVSDEMQRAETPAEVRAWVTERPEWLEVRLAQITDPSLKLGAGESEAIALALELHADALLLDDRKARQEAQKRGLTVTGTLAVLATAARRDLVDLPTAIARLQKTTFRAPATLIQSLLDQDRERKEQGGGSEV